MSDLVYEGGQGRRDGQARDWGRERVLWGVTGRKGGTELRIYSLFIWKTGDRVLIHRDPGDPSSFQEEGQLSGSQESERPHGPLWASLGLQSGEGQRGKVQQERGEMSQEEALSEGVLGSCPS